MNRLGATLISVMLGFTGCHRTPQTAAELAKALPQTYAGELHLPGNTQTLHLQIQARELSVRSEHVLEFNRVDYQVQDAQDAIQSEGEAHIRGTITAPGLAVRLEMEDAKMTGPCEDAIRLETFTGQLSPDLRSVDAQWQTSLGQKAHLTLQAVAP